MNAYIHTYMQTYTHTYIHTYIYTQLKITQGEVERIMSMVDGVVLLVDASEVPYIHISVHTDEYVCMCVCMYLWYGI